VVIGRTGSVDFVDGFNPVVHMKMRRKRMMVEE
jgi:hypothetical protein